MELISIFKNWGVPKWIKVDNGRPFGDPKMETVPALALWLIALNIQMIWNKPRTPQENAKVERCQGTLGKWTEYKRCKSTFDLQARLWEESEFYNFDFPIARRQNQKRITLFPKLGHTGRFWNPADFKIQRVLNFLSNGCWERVVSSVGQTNLYGHVLQIGTQYKNQRISIKLCPILNHWRFYDAKGSLIKTLPTAINKNSIWSLDL